MQVYLQEKYIYILYECIRSLEQFVDNFIITFKEASTPYYSYQRCLILNKSMHLLNAWMYNSTKQICMDISKRLTMYPKN